MLVSYGALPVFQRGSADRDSPQLGIAPRQRHRILSIHVFTSRFIWLHSLPYLLGHSKSL